MEKIVKKHMLKVKSMKVHLPMVVLMVVEKLFMSVDIIMMVISHKVEWKDLVR